MKHVTTGTQGGTGRLRTHLRKCDKEFARLDDIERANRNGTPIPESSMGVGGSNMVQGVLNMSNPASRSTHRTYSKEKDRRELAKMVAVCGLPFFLLILVLFIIFENYITQIMKVFQEIQLKVIFLNIKKNILIFFVVYLLIMLVDFLLLLICDVVLMVTIILHLLSIGLTMNGTCKNEY